MTTKQITFTGLIIIPILALGWTVFSSFSQKSSIRQEGIINTVGQVGNNTVNNNYPETSIEKVLPILLNSKSLNSYVQEYEVKLAYPNPSTMLNVTSSDTRIRISDIKQQNFGGGISVFKDSGITFPHTIFHVTFMTDKEVGPDSVWFNVR
ncbi:MAG: hypothetical protein AAB447_02440 [Patescibacteria group bacterium]